MITLAELRKPLTYAEGSTFVLDLLQLQGFDTTGWQEGRIQKSMITTFSMIVSELSEGAAYAANANSSTYAEGTALTIYSKERYQNTRNEAKATVGPVQLRNVSSTPYTLQPGELLIGTDQGVEFSLSLPVTVGGGSVASPTTVSGTFTCTQRGSIGNVGSGTLTRMLTPLAGVTCTNSGNPWYTIAGTDDELDASLRESNANKWSRLTAEYPEDTYKEIARVAGAPKARVDATNPRGPGTIDIYCAGQTAALSTPTLTAIQAAFAARTFYTSATYPAPTDSRVKVYSTSTFPLNVTAHIFRRSDVDEPTVISRVNTALTAYLIETPIGGWDYASVQHVLLSEDIRRRIETVDGVVSFIVSVPTAEDTLVPVNALVIPGTWNITTESV